MKRKISSVIAVFCIIMCLAGCNVKVKTSVDEATTQPITETTTAETTTEIPSTTETTTEAVRTTEAETEEETEEETKKKNSSNASSESLVRSTKEKDLSEYGDSVKYKTETDSEKKYGVIVTETIEVAYRVLKSGKQETLDRTVKSSECIRIGYHASYSDLLPAAQKHESQYSGYAERIVEIINGWRRDAGLKALKINSSLTEIANVRAEEVAWSGKHSHYRPNGRYFSSIFKENGYSSGVVGENIGWGFTTPEAVCQAWKESPTHYENIMKPEFTRIGVGVAPDADPMCGYVWVQHFSGNDLG